MKLKVDTLQKALQGIENDRQLSSEIVEDALREALTKAYRKHIEIPDAYVEVVIEDGIIHIYHQRKVVERLYELLVARTYVYRKLVVGLDYEFVILIYIGRIFVKLFCTLQINHLLVRAA